VTDSQDGGATVSVGKRKNAPRKKGGKKEKEEKKEVEDEAEEEIDPNEPRYCVCGDISFGTMVLCENPDVSRAFVLWRMRC
jgi:hypothetical protein